MTPIRPPAVAGMFYPGSPGELRSLVGELFSRAARERPERDVVPKALIAPHAGYIYSGLTAAHAMGALDVGSRPIERVVVVGPSHRFAFRGVDLPDAAAFATPLGTVRLDESALDELARLPQVIREPRAHAREHSLEVEIPFLQHRLETFTLVPLVVGEASGEEVAEVIARVWGGAETRIVISSDLSHFLPYEVARQVDGETVEQILSLERELTTDRACGALAINGLLYLAREKSLSPLLLDQRSSGDTAGDRDQVVGYCAVAFEEAHDG